HEGREDDEGRQRRQPPPVLPQCGPGEGGSSVCADPVRRTRGHELPFTGPGAVWLMASPWSTATRVLASMTEVLRKLVEQAECRLRDDRAGREDRGGTHLEQRRYVVGRDHAA